MAYHHTTHRGSDLPHTLVDGVKRFFAGVAEALTIVGTTHQRMQQVERLTAKSDADLAEMGLRREDIARYVFRDMLDT